jgi:uncharacterized membrane protein
VIWKRTIGFAIVLWLTPQLLGFLSGFTVAELMHWYGDTAVEALDNARAVRRFAIGLAFYLIYLVYLRRVPEKLLRNVLVTFLVVEVLGAVTDIALWGKPLSEAVYWYAAIRHIAVALLAIGTVLVVRRVRPNSSFKPTSLRDAG